MVISVHNNKSPRNIILKNNISEQVTDIEYQKSKENVNQKEKNKKFRLQGKAYKSYKRVVNQKYICVERKERQMQLKLFHIEGRKIIK